MSTVAPRLTIVFADRHRVAWKLGAGTRSVRIPLLSIALVAQAAVSAANAQSAAVRSVPASREPMHRLVYQNEFARVMEIRVAGGDTTGWHRHADRMIGVVIVGARTWDHWVGNDAQPLPPLAVGSVFDNGGWLPYTHRVGNIDTVAFQYVAAEVRRRSAVTPPALRDVAHLALERDSAGARVYRITLAPGESTSSHRHGAPGLTIQVGPGIVRADGTRPLRLGNSSGAGAWSWRAAGHTHVVRNVGSVPVQLVEIDWP